MHSQKTQKVFITCTLNYTKVKINWIRLNIFLPGPSRRPGWTPVIKCRRFLSFQRYVTLLGIYADWHISLARYFWECSLRYIAGSLKCYPPFWKARGMKDSQEKDYSFLGNNTFPNLYDTLVYERKFKNEYLERQIYERIFILIYRVPVLCFV